VIPGLFERQEALPAASLKLNAKFSVSEEEEKKIQKLQFI